jgi:excisionase family DNA binding protein
MEATNLSGGSVVERTLLSIPEAGEALHLGETKIKELVARGELLSVKIGKSRRIPANVVRSYVERLVTEAASQTVTS